MKSETVTDLDAGGLAAAEYEPTIVISAAGCGSRLGRGLPKSLVEVGGRAILHWQLSLLCKSLSDIRLVVGYKGRQVEQLAKSIRPDVKVFYNPHWETTRTAASLCIGARNPSGRVVSLDGDLLVHPQDFRAVAAAAADTVGVTNVLSSEPVFAELDQAGQCKGLAYGNVSKFEWTGLVNFESQRVNPGQGHVFEMMRAILPCAAKCVRCWEVDTLDDLERAQREWPGIVRGQEESRRACA